MNIFHIKKDLGSVQQQVLSPLPMGDVLKSLTQDRWKPLRLKHVLMHFTASRQYERITDYIVMQKDLLASERVVLFFLHTVYDDSLATMELYARYTLDLMNYAQKDFHQITAQDVDAFVRHHQLNGSKPATVNTIIGALKSFFRHLVDAGILTLNPTAFLKKKKYDAKQSLPGHLSHSLSALELQQLFDGMVTYGASLRDQALFRILFLTGIRAEEAVRLKWSNLVIWQMKWYLDVLGKGSKTRRVYLPRQAVDALQAYGKHIGIIGPVVMGDPRPMFAHSRKPYAHITRHGLYVLVKKWCKQLLGRTDISPHWFRHSCFTQLAHKGASLESIKALAGHESVETTMRYNEAAQLMQPAGVLFEESV